MKQVGIADLKNHLSEHLREVRQGRELIVVDRRSPIARIVPFVAGEKVLVVRDSAKRAAGLKRLTFSAVSYEGDVVDALLEERSR